MNAVELFIVEQEGNQKEILQKLHHWLGVELELTPKMRYQIPFYYQKSWICYLNPLKNDSVDFAFTRGNELSNEQGLLEAKGRKQVMSITFSSLAEIQLNVLNEILQEAILLDEQIPYASKRIKKG